MNDTVIFNPDYCCNEREVESKFIVSYLLPALGYQINMWHQEKVSKRFRLDFLAYPDALTEDCQKLVIEAKHPNNVLGNYFQQLRRYMLDLDIDYGVLTNGHEIRIYQKQDRIIHLALRTYAARLPQDLEAIRQLIGRDALLKTANINPLVQLNQPQPRDNHMKIIAIYHNKGGVGKTTTVVNLAAAFARKKQRVLIVDLDSQANTTFATGLLNFGDEIKDTIREKYVFHILRYKDRYPISQVALKARYDSTDRIDVIPSHIFLMHHEDELNRLDFTRDLLRKKIFAEQEKYDIVLIDTPPSLNLYARIGLNAAHYLLIPSDLKPFANEGLENVKEFIKEVNGFKEMLNLPLLQILGVLPNKISTNSRFLASTFHHRLQNIKEKYQLPVLDAVIHDREELAKCLEQTIEIGDLDIPDPRSVFDYKHNCKSVDEFSALANAIAKQIGV